MKLHFSKWYKETNCFLIEQWHEFYMKNELQNEDICMFELVQKKASIVIFDVEIFFIVKNINCELSIKLIYIIKFILFY